MWRVGLQDDNNQKNRSEKTPKKKNVSSYSSKPAKESQRTESRRGARTPNVTIADDQPKHKSHSSRSKSEGRHAEHYTELSMPSKRTLRAISPLPPMIASVSSLMDKAEDRPTSKSTESRRSALLDHNHIHEVKTRRMSKLSISNENLAEQKPRNNSFHLDKVKEIKDRVTKAVTNYEALHGNQLKYDALILDIQDNLASIEDDMLRINVTALLTRYQQHVDQQEQKELAAVINEGEPEADSEKDALLKSVHKWMENEKMNALAELDEEYFLSGMPDTKLLEDYMDTIQSTIRKVSKLKEKIALCKANGGNATHLENLEKQQNYLKRQMKEEILNKEYKKFSHEKKVNVKKQEFTYLKNAATEIYNLLRRTRTEGTEEKKKFEEQLNQILKLVEEKEKLIVFLEKRLGEQSNLMKNWGDDYEKLQGEYVIMEGQAEIVKNEKLKVNESLEEVRKRLEALESDHQNNYVSKAEHNTKIQSFDQKMRTLKQQNEILTYSMKDKDAAVEEYARHVQMLKNALRKANGSKGFRAAISTTSVEVEQPAKPAEAAPPASLSLTHMSVTNILDLNPTGSVLQIEIQSLKKRIDELHDENRKLKIRLYESDGTTPISSPQTSAISTLGGSQIRHQRVAAVGSRGSVTSTTSKSSVTATQRGSTTTTAKGSTTATPKGSTTATPKGSTTATQKGSTTATPKGSATTTQKGSTTATVKTSGTGQARGTRNSPTQRGKTLPTRTSTMTSTVATSPVPPSVAETPAPPSTPVSSGPLFAKTFKTIETQTVLDIKSKQVDTSDLNRFASKNVAIQVNSAPPNSRASVVTELTEGERYEAFEALRGLSNVLGKEWKETAVNISKLKPSDIEEFASILSSERDIKTMWTSLESSETQLSTKARPKTPAIEPTLVKPKTSEKREKSGGKADKELLPEPIPPVEPAPIEKGIKLTKDDIKACTVSDSISLLTEKMLCGENPSEMQVVESGVKHILHEAESMTDKIGNFVDRVQGYIGVQTDMMKHANDTIKQALPEEVKVIVDTVSSDVVHQPEANDTANTAEEASEEWDNLSVAEQVHYKMKHVEDAMREMVHESMNVFVEEVTKQDLPSCLIQKTRSDFLIFG